MENIIISNYARSGARYLSALLSSRFRELNNYISDSFSNFNEIIEEKRNNIIMKIFTDQLGYVPYKMLYIVRDPRDIIATLHKDDKLDINDLCDNTVVGWVEFNYSMMYLADRYDILFISYENMIQNEEEEIIRIGDYLDFEPKISNNSRNNELVEGKRPIGLYKEVLHPIRVKQIDETTKDCLNDLKEYLGDK